MGRTTRNSGRRRRRYLPGFLATLIWLVPVLLIAALGGFFLARNVVGARYLGTSSDIQSRPRPESMLSPEQQAKFSADRDSHVWTQGLRSSDIPSATVNTTTGRRRHRTHQSTSTPQQTPTDQTPSTAVQPDTANPTGDIPNTDATPPSPPVTPDANPTSAD